MPLFQALSAPEGVFAPLPSRGNMMGWERLNGCKQALSPAPSWYVVAVNAKSHHTLALPAAPRRLVVAFACPVMGLATHSKRAAGAASGSAMERAAFAASARRRRLRHPRHPRQLCFGLLLVGARRLGMLTQAPLAMRHWHCSVCPSKWAPQGAGVAATPGWPARPPSPPLCVPMASEKNSAAVKRQRADILVSIHPLTLSAQQLVCSPIRDTQPLPLKQLVCLLPAPHISRHHGYPPIHPFNLTTTTP